MRTWLFLTATAAGLAAAPAAFAQQSVTFGGVNPTQIQNVPVTTSNVAVPIAAPQQLAQRSFSLQRFLPRISFPTNRPVHGTSTFPTEAQMPGKDYMSAFRFRRPQPIPN